MDGDGDGDVDQQQQNFNSDTELFYPAYRWDSIIVMVDGKKGQVKSKTCPQTLVLYFQTPTVWYSLVVLQS